MKLLVLLLLFSSCSSVYYNFWETLGKEKRDLLASNLKEANKQQNALEEQFADTFERIKTEYKFSGGELEDTYNRLKFDYARIDHRRKQLSDRIDKAEQIAEDLFSEWKKEARQMGNRTYRQKSERKLATTQERFQKMHRSMLQVEKEVDGMMKKFNDRVIFLKHNLNARALSGIKNEFKDIQLEMKDLSAQIDKSNKEAEAFIQQMR